MAFFNGWSPSAAATAGGGSPVYTGGFVVGSVAPNVDGCAGAGAGSGVDLASEAA